MSPMLKIVLFAAVAVGAWLYFRRARAAGPDASIAIREADQRAREAAQRAASDRLARDRWENANRVRRGQALLDSDELAREWALRYFGPPEAVPPRILEGRYPDSYAQINPAWIDHILVVAEEDWGMPNVSAALDRLLDLLGMRRAQEELAGNVVTSAMDAGQRLRDNMLDLIF